MTTEAKAGTTTNKNKKKVLKRGSAYTTTQWVLRKDRSFSDRNPPIVPTLGKGWRLVGVVPDPQYPGLVVGYWERPGTND